MWQIIDWNVCFKRQVIKFQILPIEMTQHAITALFQDVGFKQILKQMKLHYISTLVTSVVKNEVNDSGETEPKQ